MFTPVDKEKFTCVNKTLQVIFSLPACLCQRGGRLRINQVVFVASAMLGVKGEDAMSEKDEEKADKAAKTERLEPAEQPEDRATRPLGNRTERLGEAGATEVMASKTEALASDAGQGTKVMTDSPAKRELGATQVVPDQSSGQASEESSSSAQSLQTGTVLRERFRITGELGSGGMGTVYKATDLLKEEAYDENTDIALKVLKPDFANARLSFMALQREARRAQQLAHPNIVTVYDFDRADGVIFMTMELMSGKPLEALLDDHPDGLDGEQARHIARHVTEGLAYAHKQGIVHSDLKPENVFVLKEGRAKILDFGIARAYQSTKTDFVEESIRGFTPPYATPELQAGVKPTPADDVYALGCVLYETFTGKHPFDYASGKDAKEAGLKPQRSPVFKRAEWKAISAALDFDVKRRPVDADQFRKRFFPSPVRKTALVVSVLVVVAALAYTWIYEPEPGPDIPFESLPAQTQEQISRNLGDARLFHGQGDLNSALQLYDAVLRVHAGNRDAVRGMNETIEVAIARIEQAHAEGNLGTDSARLTLEALLGYETLPGTSRDAVRNAINKL
jgi:hypothetical protein